MTQLDYELIDFGEGFKFERFGPVKLIRPEAIAVRQPKAPVSSWFADSICTSLGHNKFSWDPILDPWIINYGDIKLELRLSQSKNIGIFPEQQANWTWLAQKAKYNSKILNLFAYTGAASLVCAQAGAYVTHVDSSKSSVKWASDNARLSNLQNIRWIVEDARIFLKREIARKNTYDGLILDPPPFGDNFLFNRDILDLLSLCKQVLKPEPDLFLFNSYAVNLKPKDLEKLLWTYFKDGKINSGELQLGGELSLSTYVQF